MRRRRSRSSEGFTPKWIVFAIQPGSHFQAGGSLGGADELQNLLVAAQRLPCPVVADLTEQTAFDGVIFGCASGIVGDRNGKTESIAKLLLEAILPGAACGRVASPGVSQDQQASRVGITPASFLPPPSADGGHSECGGLVGDANEHRSAIGLGIIDAIQNGDALGQRTRSEE